MNLAGEVGAKKLSTFVQLGECTVRSFAWIVGTVGDAADADRRAEVYGRLDKAPNAASQATSQIRMTSVRLYTLPGEARPAGCRAQNAGVAAPLTEAVPTRTVLAAQASDIAGGVPIFQADEVAGQLDRLIAGIDTSS